MAVQEDQVFFVYGECPGDVETVPALIVVLLIIGLLFRCQTVGRCWYACRRALFWGGKVGNLVEDPASGGKFFFPKVVGRVPGY